MLVVLALLISLVSAAVQHASLDLFPIALGLQTFDDTGDQRLWLESHTFEIDLSMAPISEVELWEGSVYADRSGGGGACEYSISYKENGNVYVIRQGGFGYDSVTEYDTYYAYSSSVLWVRGSEVPNTATHLVVRIDQCYLARYFTISEFETWNGQAYLMDWSGNTHVRSGWSDDLYRLADFDENYAEYQIPISRDSSIFDHEAGYWNNDFYFDYSPFADLTRPVLEFWFYKGIDDSSYMYFYFCDYTPLTPNCASTGDYTQQNTYTYYDYSYYETGFARVFFDIYESRTDFAVPLGDDPYNTVLFYLSDYAAGSPYARLWDVESPTRTTPPLLFDFSEGSLSGDCETEDNDAHALQYYGPGVSLYACNSDDGATLFWTVPPSVAAIENPWMGWFEYVEDASSYYNAYEIQMNGDLLHETSIPDSYDSYALMGWDFQIALPTFANGDQVRVTMTGEAMAFLAWVPFYQGFEDSCTPSPCQNAGACHNYYWDYVCICPMGWEGKNCEISTDDCGDNACLNGGTCVDGLLTYTCSCTAPWTGKRCEVRQDYCAQAECLNGGTCVTGVNGLWTCDCSTAPTWGGKYCEKSLDSCRADPFACMNGGTCVTDVPPAYHCDCSTATGFVGDWCEIPAACSPNPCQNDGWCSVEGGVQRCTCSDNHFGETCQYSTLYDFESDCTLTAIPCENGGSCDATTRVCVCVGGYTGDYCDIPPGCQGNPCLHGGSCYLINNAPQCSCPGNYLGDFCEITLKGVEENCHYNGGCMNGGDCREQGTTPETYKCVNCDAGWSGDNCEVFDACNPNPCLNDGWCAPNMSTDPAAPAYLCTCVGNYFGDECEQTIYELHTFDCRSNADCMNGGVCTVNHKCSCDNLLWTGARCETSKLCDPNPCKNGGWCEEVNGAAVCTCTSNWFGDDCSSSVVELMADCRYGTCVNGVCSTTTNRCACNSGWTGTWCQESTACNPNPCQNNGRCYTDNGVAMCSCTGSFFGTRCQDTLAQFATHCDSPSSRPCQNGATCDTVTHKCRCLPGFMGDFCDMSSLCSPDPCQNGGTCYVQGGKANCMCPGNFFGVNCQNSLDNYFGDCGKPCENGGQCVLYTNEGYKCKCNPNWTGEFCDVPVPCFGTNNPCQNGGHCMMGASNQAICICSGTFVGSHCQWDMMDYFKANFELLSADCNYGSPCMNGGSCTKKVSGAFTCDCPSGYLGAHCEIPAGCSPNPCQAHGRCDVKAGKQVCYCAAGRIGDHCEWSLDEFIQPDCRFQHCWNGGKCVEIKGVHQCSCSGGFSGDWCEVPAACDPNPCMNDGQCVAAGNTYSCKCAGDHFGPTCEESDLSDRVEKVQQTVSQLERIKNVPKKN